MGEGEGAHIVAFSGRCIMDKLFKLFIYSSISLYLLLSLCHIRIHARLGTLINGIPTVLLWSIVKRVPLLKFYEFESETEKDRERETAVGNRNTLQTETSSYQVLSLV